MMGIMRILCGETIIEIGRMRPTDFPVQITVLFCNGQGETYSLVVANLFVPHFKRGSREFKRAEVPQS